MIPQGGTIEPEREMVETLEQPSLTYRLDLEKGTISGHIDGLEAVKQAVVKILQTRRFAHLIYSSNYGQELDSVIGRDPLWAYAEIERHIKEALLQDDRIMSVDEMNITFSGEQAMAEFTVRSMYGAFHMAKEVRKDG
ncbi:DUF2634 domain-containing protein [Paenibacillus sp. JCM 10914]|uniref:DUF2634 domain-containing protein n=1 Tax=Paenibacillus sp. JCM 10914 TaxID=1236974 RepID=UPI0003CC9F52|nr:DUF2634 domain-containing protein [Paenibacillus sp. JCM 10914]GAE07281.1 phage-like element PBSX protein xkdS [Paenibacillus sp. JCM 10914]